MLQNIIIYVTLATELFIDKDVSKTDETLHEECHLKRRKWHIRCLVWHLVLIVWSISIRKINFIKICCEKRFFYVMMTSELFIKYFCNIKLCCLWRFNFKMSVIYWEMLCAEILCYAYCFRARHLFTMQLRRTTKR